MMEPRPSSDMLSNGHSLEKQGQEGEGANAWMKVSFLNGEWFATGASMKIEEGN